MSSFDFAIELAMALVTPLIERRPLKGLNNDVIRKMSFFLNRTIDKTLETAASEAAPPLETKNVTIRAKKRAILPARPSASKITAHKSKVVKFENTGSKRK